MWAATATPAGFDDYSVWWVIFCEHFLSCKPNWQAIIWRFSFKRVQRTNTHSQTHKEWFCVLGRSRLSGGEPIKNDIHIYCTSSCGLLAFMCMRAWNVASMSSLSCMFIHTTESKHGQGPTGNRHLAWLSPESSLPPSWKLPDVCLHLFSCSLSGWTVQSVLLSLTTEQKKKKRGRRRAPYHTWIP